MKRLVRFVLLTLGYLVAVLRVLGRSTKKSLATRGLVLAFVAVLIATGVNLTRTTPAYAVAYEPTDSAVKMTHASGGMLWNNFRGTNDDFNPGTGDFTIEGWFRPTSVCSSTICDLFGKESGYVFAVFNGLYYYATYHAGSGWYPGWTSTGVKAQIGQWQHVAWVRSGQSLGLYLNGISIWYNSGALTLASENISTTSAFSIGGRYGVGGETFDGLIDEVRFWKSARTAAQIADAKDRTLSTTELALAALKGYWDFNDAPSNGAIVRTSANLDPDASSNSGISTYLSDAVYQTVATSTTVNGATVVTFPRSFITQNGGWRIPQGVTRVDTLVVGGGGGGGTRHGGGGGAGGYVSNTGVSVVPGASKSIIVGGGGFPTASAVNGAGSVGTDSYFGATRALGGGSGTNTAGADGGSGGGGGGSQAPTNGIQNSTMGYGLGNNGAGGSWGSSESNWAGGGGGGAGTAGSSSSPAGGNSSTANGGAGGNGLTNKITGSTVCYAAGGGGGVNASGAAGAGGKCGSSTAGGAGSVSNTDASDGSESTGSGGGGSGFVGGANGYAGHGGTGVVIVSYSATSISAAANGNCDVYKYNTVVGGTKYTYQEIQSTLTTAATASVTAANLTCNWTVPTSVTSVNAVIVGGGGGGGGDGGSGGGGGATRVQQNIATLTPGATISVSVGTGGASGVWSGNSATAGGTSSISGPYSGGTFSYSSPGGAGGTTGPGAAGVSGGSNTGFAAGGAGGNSGAGAAYLDYGFPGSAGFNATSILGFTRYFGGGGGGGVYENSTTWLFGGAGGLGGGGQGANANDNTAYAGEPGKPNTGGGGGAGVAGPQRGVRGGVGGSGTVIFFYVTPTAGTMLSITTAAAGNFLDGIVTRPVIQLVDDQGAAVSTSGVSVTATIDQSGVLTNNIVNTDANGQASFASLTGTLQYNKYYSIAYTATGVMPTSQLLPSGNIPVNLTISTSTSSNGFFSNGVWYADTVGDSILSTTDLQTALNAGTNVTLQTGGGTITFANSVATTGTSAGSLTVSTDSSVSVASGATITLTGTNKGLSVKATSSITSAAAIAANGPISLDGSSLSVQSNLTSNYLDSKITLKSKASIAATSASTLRTNSGKIVLWSDSDNSGGGNMALAGTLCSAPTGTTCDTNATTGGDDIILGGGAADTNDATLPGGYASGTSTSSDVNASGIQLGTLSSPGTGPKIYSSGGNITAKGQTVVSSTNLSVWALGLTLVSGTEINSGAGKINLAGATAASGWTSPGWLAGVEFNAWGGAYTTKLISTNAAADSITVRSENLQYGGGSKITGGNSGTQFKNTSGGGLLVQANIVDDGFQASFAVTGPIAFEPVGTSFGENFSFDSSDTFTSTPGGFTIGKSGNTSTVNIVSPLSSAGPIRVYGSTVKVANNLAVTNNTELLVKASDDIVVSGGTNATTRTTLSTVGGDITLWSNSDFSGTGAIATSNFTSLLSRGGKITLAGSGASGEASPTGYATGSSTYPSGIKLGTSAVASNTLISSDGQDITIRGKSSLNVGDALGVFQYAGATIDSGNATVKIYGQTSGTTGGLNSHAVELGVGGGTPTLITSSKSMDTAIDINGQTSGSSTDAKGVNFWAGDASNYVKVAATGAAGNVTITGSASTATQPGVSINWARILAKGGSVTLDSGSNPTAFGNSSASSVVYLGADSAGGASGNVDINTGSFSWAGTVNARTSGDLSIDSGSAQSFTGPVTIPTNLVLAEVRNLRVGNAGSSFATQNAVNVTVSVGISVAGNIQVFGAALTNSALVQSTGGTIAYTGSTFGSTSALSTDGRDISVAADQMTIGAAITTNRNSAGIVSLLPVTAAKNIDLGAADSSTLLGLSPTELGYVTAKTLRVGSASFGKDINVSTNITIASAQVNALALRGSGNVTNTNSAILTAPNLAIVVGGTISLSGANSIGGNLAIVAGGASGGSGVSFGNAGNFTPGSVDATDPVYGLGKNISISSAPAIGSTEVRYLNQTWSAPPVITIRDAYGYSIASNNNSSTSYTTTVTSSGSPAVTGTSPSIAGGTQTFSNLKFMTSAGTTTLTFSTAGLASGGTSSVTTGTYDVKAGDPASIAIATTTTTTQAGKTGFGITATLKDAGGGTVSGPHSADTIDVSVADGDSDPTNNATIISGNHPATVSGVANFANLILGGKTGVTYTLTFTVTYTDSNSVSQTKSATQNVTLTAGDATKLKISTPAAGFVNRALFTTQPAVDIQDAYGNKVTTGSTTVTASLAAIGSASTQALTGTATANSSSGTATFSGLGKSGLIGDKRLTFSANNLSSDTQDFTLTFGAAHHIISTVSSTLVNDTVFGTQPVVTIKDQDENTVTDSTLLVTLTSPDATIGGTLLNGAVAMNAVAGVADFNGKNVKLTGTVGGKTLRATATGLTPVDSTVTISFGAATKLAITRQASGAVNGVAFTVQPQVTVQDVSNNTVTNSNAAITVESSGSVLTGNSTPPTLTNGVATFSGLTLTGTKGTYVLTFRSGSLAIDFQNIAVTWGAATKLVVTTQPQGFVNRTNFTVQPVVTVQDASGNTVEDSSISIDVAIDSGNLTGTTQVRAVNGIATFSGLGKNGLIGAKRLTFTKTGGGISQDIFDFTLTYGAATKLTETTNAAGFVNRVAFTAQPVIEIQDADGNKVANSNASVTVAMTGGGTLTGTKVATANGGVATFSGLIPSGSIANSNILNFTSSPLTGTSQTAFTLTHGAADHIRTGAGYNGTLSILSGATRSGINFGQQPAVAIEDADNNLVTTGSEATQTVTVTADASGLSGTTTVRAVAGLATFTNLKMTALVGAYTLTYLANMSNSTGTTPFTLTYGTATKLAVTTQAAGFVNRTDFTTQPVVKVQDSMGNTVGDSVISIDVAIDSGTLTGTTQVRSVAGIATFSGLGKYGTVGNKRLTFSKTGGGLSVDTQDFVLTYGAIHHLNVNVATSLANDTVWATQPVVAIQDQDNNTVDITDTVTLAATGATTVAIGGNTSLATVHGIADFVGQGVKLTGLAGSKTLTATITSGNGFAKDTTISLGYGVATKLTLTTEPTGFVNRTNFTVQPQVTVQDVSGNTVGNSSISIDASIDTADLTGTTQVRAVNGIATFVGLGKAGTIGQKTITFKDTEGLLAQASKPFLLTHGAAQHISLVAASTLVNATEFAAQPVVTIYDQDNNVVTTGSDSTQTITLSAVSATMGGTRSMAAVNGVADFNGKGISLTGTIGSKRVTASITALSLNSSVFVNVTFGAAAKLAISTDAADASNGSQFGTQPVILVQDVSGNLVTDSTASVQASVSNGTLDGTDTINAIGGVATFTNLRLTATAGVKVLTYASNQLSSATQNITAVTGAPTQLRIDVAGSLVNDTVFATQPVVTLLDSTGVVVSAGVNASRLVTLSSPDATIGGTVSMSANAGVADFNGKGVKLTGLVGARSLVATITQPNTVTQIATVTITYGAADHLHIASAAAGAANRIAFTNQPVIEVLDVSNNRVTNSTALISVAATGANGAILGGDTSMNAGSGIAYFAQNANGLKLTGAIGTYHLTYSSGSLSADSEDITLTHGVATKVVVSQSASGAKSGQAFTVQPKIQVQDADSNLLTTGAASTASIQITVSSDAYDPVAHTGVNLTGPSGFETVAAIAGEATFSGARLEGVAANAYVLKYSIVSTPGYNGLSTSQNLALSAGTQTHLAVVQQPTAIVAGAAFSPVVTVEILDAWNNRVLDVANTVTVKPSLVDDALATTVLDSTKTAVANASGLVTFTGLTFTKAGSQFIQFTSSGLVSAISNTFTITNAQAHHLVWVTSPVGAKNDYAIKGAGNANPELEIRDQYENPVVTGAATSVDVTEATSSGNITSISGGSARNAAGSARVIFSNLVLRAKVGSYTLRFSATNGSLPINGTHVDSLAPVSITFGDPAALRLTRAAAGANSGTPFTTQPKLNIEDTAGNVIGDSGLSVTVSSTSSQTLGGTKVLAAVAGSVDFTDSGLKFTGTVATGLSLKYAITYNSSEISTTQTIDLNPGLAVALTIGQQPTTVKTRVAFNPVPTVVLRDASGNQVTSDSSSTVTAQLKDSSGNPVGSETAGFTASSGLVAFTGLAFQAPSTTNYYVTFKLTSNGQASTSTAFDILPGVATELRITRQPSTDTVDHAPGKTGELLSTQPIAKLYDQDGNLVTTANSGSVTIRVHSTDSAGDLSEGAVTANITGGIATFSGVKFVGTPGVVYDFDFATASPNPVLTSNASSSISVTHNDATHLVVTRAAANGRSGMLFNQQPIITVKDRYENTVTSGPDSTADITATGEITAPTTGSSNPSNNVVSAVDGVARYVALGLTGLSTNTYRLNFNIVGSNTVAGVSQSNVTISYGSADHLTLTTQPVGGNATGQNLVVQPAVEVRDGAGNKVANSTLTVTASIISTNGLTLLDSSAARLTGASKAAVGGVASFDALDLYGLPGVDYTLKFAVNGLGYATSNAIQVTHAAAHHLYIATQPTGGNPTGANLNGQPVVQLRDIFQNLVSADSSDVLTARLSTTSSTEHLAGSSTATFANGVASFAGLQVIALPETNYTLDFTTTVGGNTITSLASNSFQVTYSTATKLAVYQQPVAGTTGTQLTAQPVIEVQDFYGNRVRNFSGTVTASVGGSGATLTNSGNSSGSPLDQTVVDGRAVFSGLELTAIPATDYQLTFASNTLTSVNSGNLRVTPGAPVRIEILNQPIGSQTGAALTGQPVVKIVDSFGNTVTQNSSTVITATLTSGVGGTLSRVVSSNPVAITATTSNGVATFSNLYMRGLTNHNYQMTFSSGDLASAVSADFQVSHASVTQLVWNTQPTVGMTGSPITRAAVLELQDLDGNIATSDSSTVVTAAVTTGSGASPLQNATATADHGVVTFSNLILTGTPGTAYKLTFTGVIGSSSFSAPASSDLILTHAVPAKLTMRGGNVTGGLTGENLTSQPTLYVRDRFNNIATTDNSTVVTAAIYNDNTGAVSGSVTATAVNGEVTFAGLKASGVPGTAYTLRFAGDWSGTTLTAVNSNTFTVSKRADVSLAYTAQQYVPSGIVHPAFSTDSPGVVTYSTSTSTSICSLNTSNGDITINGVGTCAVRVDVAATTYYLAHYAEASLVISKANQAPVTITSPSSVNFWSTLTPAATGGTGTGAIFFSVNGSCRIVGTTLIPGDAGSPCLLSATRMGDTNYRAAVPDFQTITVRKLSQQTLSIANATDMIVGTLDLFTSGGSGSGSVSYSVNSGDASRCSISGTTLTASASGDCRISAIKGASTNYDVSNTATATIHVSKDVQNVVFTSTAPSFPVAQGSYVPTATSTSALAVTFSIVTSNSTPACAFDSLDSRKINFLTSGDCEIVATQVGNARYSAASASQKITVGVLNQTINFATLADKTFGTPAFQVAATSNSGLPVAIATTSNSNACTISNLGVITLTAAGLCELQATQAGNNTYAAATPVIRSFMVDADLAGAPHIYSASASTHAFTVAFTAPSYTGGSTISAYSLTVTDAAGNVFENSACPAGTSTVSCTIVGISNDVAYTAVVRAITVAGMGAASNVSVALTPLDAPVAVTNLAASTSSSDLVVTWEPPTALDSSFTRYEVYAAPIGSPMPSTPNVTVSNPTATGVTIANIVPVVSAPSPSPSPTTASASVRIRRASVNSNPAPSPSSSGQSVSPAGYQVAVVTITQSSTVAASSNTSNGVQTSFSTALAPSRLTLDPSGSSLLISWSPPTADGGSPVTGYDVAVNGSTICAATSALICEFTGMTAGHTYAVSVVAKNAVGSGVAASDSYSTPAPPAAAGSGGGGLNLGNSNGMAILSGSVKQVSTKGGSILTLHARNFAGVFSAIMDGQNLRIVSNGEDEITLELPAHVAGSVDITFKSKIGTLVFQDAVTYVAPPRAPITQRFSRFGAKSVAASGRIRDSITAVVLGVDKPKAMVCVALIPSKHSATTVTLARQRAANVCAVGSQLNGNLVVRTTTKATSLTGPSARTVEVTYSY
jgi:hypothetical protein